jgi:predicted nucleic acid-binding protein
VLLALLIRQLPWQIAARQLYARDPDWSTESHALVEVTSALTRYVRTRELTLDQAIPLLHEAIDRVEPHVLQVAHEDALRIAVTRGVSAYDARFLVAAMQLGVRVVTEDGKLRAAAPELTMSINEALAS